MQHGNSAAGAIAAIKARYCGTAQRRYQSHQRDRRAPQSEGVDNAGPARGCYSSTSWLFRGPHPPRLYPRPRRALPTIPTPESCRIREFRRPQKKTSHSLSSSTFHSRSAGALARLCLRRRSRRASVSFNPFARSILIRGCGSLLLPLQISPLLLMPAFAPRSSVGMAHRADGRWLPCGWPKRERRMYGEGFSG